MDVCPEGLVILNECEGSRIVRCEILRCAQNDT